MVALEATAVVTEFEFARADFAAVHPLGFVVSAVAPAPVKRQTTTSSHLD
jgi:hypothetical protein